MRLRPHHGLCIGFFEGKGYSDAFVTNMKEIIEYLNEHPDDTFYLESKMDRICFACPNNIDKVCLTADKVSRYDSKCLELCQLKPGDHLSWKQYRRLLEKNVLQENKLFEICGDCGWYPICEKAVKNVKGND